MSDNAKLKELAETLKRAIEQAEHKPGEWAGTAQSMGGICCPGVPFQIGKPWAKEEPWASFSYKRDSWLAVAAVNALPRLLGLIADNEWLTKAVGLQVIRRFVGDDDQKNIDELVAAGIQVDKELIVQLKAENERLAAACERAEQIIIVECKAASLAKVRANLLEANRDQLRAEVTGLKTGYEAYEQVNAELKAEVEGLCREREGKVLCDLELFETLRDSANTEADEHRQCMATYRPLRQANLDSVVKKCDDLLAAMGKGEQS